MASLPYVQLIEIKRWADRALYEAVAGAFPGLSPEDQFVLLRVLDHIHAVDLIFQHHLRGLPHGFAAARSETLPGLAALAAGSRAAGDWYAGHIGALGAEAFDESLDFVFTSGKPGRMTRGQILLHVCLHGTYHRGNAGALLQLRGLTPGPDSITDYLEAAAVA